MKKFQKSFASDANPTMKAAAMNQHKKKNTAIEFAAKK
jgi:hypothetical protein